MAIAVEQPEFVTGLGEASTVVDSTAARGERSSSADTDTTVYPLRKWAKLAAKGNPTVLTALFVPEYEVRTVTGRMLTDSAHLFVSAAAGNAYRGYMNSQVAAMTGQRNKRTNRPELIHSQGWDTKFGYHALRLGFQGVELMRTGRLALPFTGHTLEFLLSVRAGRIEKAQALKEFARLDTQLERAIAETSLPDRADLDGINELLHRIYTEEWNR